ncbi:MAG: CBS domain-containing protein [Longimicrobiales bacterium]|nr:CBS domain-containing protein [Longimicrobiales bacterium]
MKLRDILRTKGSEVIQIGPDAPILDAVRVLSEHRIGCLVVTRDGEIVGVVSERDVLNMVAARPDALADTRVADIMTTDVIVAVPGDDIDYVMNIMTNNKIRHLPIVDDGSLAGIVSIGDVVNELRRSVEAENRHLKDYIQGAAR